MPRPHLLHRGVWRGSNRGAPAAASGNPRRRGDPRLLALLEGPLPESRLWRVEGIEKAGRITDSENPETLQNGKTKQQILREGD